MVCTNCCLKWMKCMHDSRSYLDEVDMTLDWMDFVGVSGGACRFTPCPLGTSTGGFYSSYFWATFTFALWQNMFWQESQKLTSRLDELREDPNNCLLYLFVCFFCWCSCGLGVNLTSSPVGGTSWVSSRTPPIVWFTFVCLFCWCLGGFNEKLKGSPVGGTSWVSSRTCRTPPRASASSRRSPRSEDSGRKFSMLSMQDYIVINISVFVWLFVRCNIQKMQQRKM